MITHKVALIIPYFGKEPDLYKIWALSAGRNPDFDFHIFSDVELDCRRYNNIYVHSMQFDTFVKRVKSVLGGVLSFISRIKYVIIDQLSGLYLRIY